ncbi:hypothetical protein SBA4_460010 [Candidatus Sulfopaludibacter sp. SbA4]|nr:hypothetical protein SBA4_460010 [Candidatus Sulfopaludibacter sp. SbA4]
MWATFRNGGFTATILFSRRTADGQRFLTTGQVGGSITADRLNVVVSWQARVNR